ncbi:hypothetical protein RB195_019499 [Necator americanus]|uniref:Uncharacterized protein n=1 Tax=Necator americanus TaxID=51031 RepID=A0ABR1CGI3_NECAM
MDQGATLRHFAKKVVNLSSGLLLARLPIPKSRNVGCVELLLSLGDLAGGPLFIAVRRPESPPRHYEAMFRSLFVLLASGAVTVTSKCVDGKDNVITFHDTTNGIEEDVEEIERAVTPRKTKRGKRDDLQGIRGFAILFVLLMHLKPDSFRLGFIGILCIVRVPNHQNPPWKKVVVKFNRHFLPTKVQKDCTAVHDVSNCYVHINYFEFDDSEDDGLVQKDYHFRKRCRPIASLYTPGHWL